MSGQLDSRDVRHRLQGRLGHVAGSKEFMQELSVLWESVMFSKPDEHLDTHQIHDHTRPEGPSNTKSGNWLPDTLSGALEHHHCAGCSGKQIARIRVSSKVAPNIQVRWERDLVASHEVLGRRVSASRLIILIA